MDKRTLDLSALERHGISALIHSRMQLQRQIGDLTGQLEGLDAEAARSLAGRVPNGVTISSLIQDPRTGEVYYLVPDANPLKAALEGAKAAAGALGG